MSYPTNVHTWTSPFTEETMASELALALRAEHAHTDAVVKRIARATGLSSLTIRKWYEARNTPKVAHLMLLAQSYPAVRLLVLEWLGISPADAHQILTLATPSATSSSPIYTPDHVGINVQVPLRLEGILNHRQLWFLGQLQNAAIMKAADLRKIWGITARTAERDLAGLLAAGAIVFSGARKNGCYLLTPDFRPKPEKQSLLW
jgi:transcriptional regulator with XRE-family HTH domain